jgi:hypothetical protein
MRSYGWSYDYLLWGISWLNVQLMIADAPRSKDLPTDEDGNVIDESKIERHELNTKEDIKNYIKGII